MYLHDEFVKVYREQMIDRTQLNQLLKSNRTQKLGLRDKVYLALGDGLISIGKWVKNLSLTTIDKKSISNYSQNY